MGKKAHLKFLESCVQWYREVEVLAVRESIELEEGEVIIPSLREKCTQLGLKRWSSMRRMQGCSWFLQVAGLLHVKEGDDEGERREFGASFCPNFCSTNRCYGRMDAERIEEELMEINCCSDFPILMQRRRPCKDGGKENSGTQWWFYLLSFLQKLHSKGRETGG